MLSVDFDENNFARFKQCKMDLLGIHQSKISLHNAKSGYSYPTIRLPHTFSALVGLSTRIYQTVQHGALAFLVVVSSADTASESSPDKHENALSRAKASVFTRRCSGCPPVRHAVYRKRMSKCTVIPTRVLTLSSQALEQHGKQDS